MFIKASDKRNDGRGVSNQRLDSHVRLFDHFQVWQHRIAG